MYISVNVLKGFVFLQLGLEYGLFKKSRNPGNNQIGSWKMKVMYEFITIVLNKWNWKNSLLPKQNRTHNGFRERWSSCTLRRPQNFAKSSPYFWLALHRTKVRSRFDKILRPSQNIWTLFCRTVLMHSWIFQFYSFLLLFIITCNTITVETFMPLYTTSRKSQA